MIEKIEAMMGTNDDTNYSRYRRSIDIELLLDNQIDQAEDDHECNVRNSS